MHDNIRASEAVKAQVAQARYMSSSLYVDLGIVMTLVICIFIRICMGKITIVSVTYENVAILKKSSYLALAECFFPPVWSLRRFTAILLVLEKPVCSLYMYFPRLGTRTKSSQSDPLKENGRKFSPAGPVASKFRVEHGR